MLFLIQGVDLVPTDVAAGLILLSQKHKRKKEQMNQVVISDKPNPRYVTTPFCRINTQSCLYLFLKTDLELASERETLLMSQST